MHGLILYDSALDALAECKHTDEVKGWADRAAATQAYARMAKNKTLEVDAAEIRIRAERRLGEMLTEQKQTVGMSTGARGVGKSAVVSDDRTPTLAEIGVSKDLSARSQKLAAVPKAEFEGEVAEWRGRVEAEGARVSARLEAAGAAKLAAVEPEPVNTAHAEAINDLALELDALRRIVESDDKLAEAWAEAKTATAKLADMGRLYDAKCVELAAMTREAKRWRRKCEQFERGELK